MARVYSTSTGKELWHGICGALLGRAGHLLAGLLIPAGTLAFMAYLQVVLGNALLFLRTQAAWARSLAPLWVRILLSQQYAASPAYRIPCTL